VQVALAAGTLVEGKAHREQLDVLIAGDDEEANCRSAFGRPTNSVRS
jgi:predicted dinucleotide-binding enzyme